KVKIFGFFVTFTVCLCMLALFYCLGTLSPEENKIIAGSLFNFLFLSAFRAAIIDFIVLLWLYFLMTDYFKNQLELERSKLDKLKERAVNQRSEEHTSELQSREKLVCRLLLEKRIVIY